MGTDVDLNVGVNADMDVYMDVDGCVEKNG